MLPPGVTVMTIRPLYSSGQVAAATFFGGPVAGGVLLGTNYKRLGEPGKARLAVGLSVLGMAAVVGLGLLLEGAARMLPIAAVVVMSTLAKALQGEDYARHVALGGRRGSSWNAFGVGLASLAVFVGLFFGYTLITDADEITFGRSSVRYTDGGTRIEAQAVGDALTALGALTPEAAMTVEVRRDHVLHIVIFVVQDQAFTDNDLLAAFHGLASELSRRAFANEAVDIWLADDQLEPRRKLTWETRPREPGVIRD